MSLNLVLCGYLGISFGEESDISNSEVVTASSHFRPYFDRDNRQILYLRIISLPWSKEKNPFYIIINFPLVCWKGK